MKIDIAIFCHVCKSSLRAVFERGSKDVIIYVVPCEKCAAQQSVHPTIATATLEDSPFETGIHRNAVVQSNRNSG